MIYVNDINRHIHLGACNIYADDTLVYCTANSMPQLKDNIQKCICDIHDWYCKNQLVVNESKSNVMQVTTRQRLNHIEETRLDVYIGEFKLVQAECIDYLGMKIDENISWNAQTDSLCKKLVFIVSRLSRLRKVLPSYMLAYIYILGPLCFRAGIVCALLLLASGIEPNPGTGSDHGPGTPTLYYLQPTTSSRLRADSPQQTTRT